MRLLLCTNATDPSLLNCCEIEDILEILGLPTVLSLN